VSDPAAVARRTEKHEDEVVVRIVVERLTVTVAQPAEVVEAAVRDELERRRASARIQTFVPIFAERAARRRLVSDDGDEPG
jgi:hypothetical protein